MSKLPLIVFFTISYGLHAAGPLNSSPLQRYKDSLILEQKKHSPRKATIYSLVLPGSGQAYNRKYWKIPVIYAALGVSAYLIKDNRQKMRADQDQLKLMLDNDSTTTASDASLRLGVDVLRARRNTYRTNRDYSIIAFAGFYLLNVLDAAIDAHFYNFNIDKPLAQQQHKNWHVYSAQVGRTPAVGLAWRF